MAKGDNIKYNLIDVLGNDPKKADEYYKERMSNELVCCFNLERDSNVGLIIRTASLFGFGGVHIVGKRSFDARPSVGCQNYIPIRKISATCGVHNDSLDFDAIRDYFSKISETHTVVMVEHGGVEIKHMNLEIKKLGKPPIFVMGQESTGIPPEILETVKHLRITIPQKGVCRSFNVNNAFTIIGYEWTRES